MTYLTTAQAGVRLGITARRVVALIASGRLAAARVGRDWLIDPRAVAAYCPAPAGRPAAGK